MIRVTERTDLLYYDKSESEKEQVFCTMTRVSERKN